MISRKDFLPMLKLFPDDTSLFSVIRNSQTSANDVNKDLEMIHNWAFQLKMSFNPDSTKLNKLTLVVKQKTTSSSLSV